MKISLPVRIVFPFLLALSLQAALPVMLPCGSIRQMERMKEGARASFVGHQAAVKNSQLIPSENIPRSWLEQRPAGAAKVYVILTVSVLKGKVLGTQDYIMKAEGKDSVCLGMAVKKKELFDFRRLSFTGPGEVKLIFAVPAAAWQARLRCAYDKIPMPEVELSLQKKPAPAVRDGKTAAAVSGKNAGGQRTGKNTGTEISPTRNAAPAVKKTTAPAVKKTTAPAVKKPTASAARKKSVSSAEKKSVSRKSSEKVRKGADPKKAGSAAYKKTVKKNAVPAVRKTSKAKAHSAGKKKKN